MTEEQVNIGGYRIKRYMWTGQHSQVLEVIEPASNRHFAMKILLPEQAHDSVARAELFHEANMGARLAHPNIIKILKVSKDAANPHFVMEFFPAGSLKTRIQRAKDESEQSFLREHLPSILKQWATALAFIHSKGFVHRDVKPDNLLVNGFGEAKLIDFALVQGIQSGLGRLFFRRKLFGKIIELFFGRRATTAGTMSYMSPEQIRSDPLDGRADMYSFGASLFEILTGRPPFRAGSANELLQKHLKEMPVSPCILNPDVTQEFSEFVLRLLSKKRTGRPNNFHEILMAMRNMRIFKSANFKPPPQH